MKSRLRIKIERSKFSIKEIAEECDKSQQTLNSYLNGTHSPTLKTLECIANKLRCSVFELLEEPTGYCNVYMSNGTWMGIYKII